MDSSKLHAGGIPAPPQSNAANGGQSETANQNQFNSQSTDSSAFPYGHFADLMMDSAFKRAFGDDSGAHGNKQRLLLLLQLILPEKNIVDISYCNTEHISPYLDSKNIRIDVECLTQDGKRCIVEMQKLNQHYFSERMVYYSAAAVLSQIPTGQDSYDFMPVYMIAILNFRLNKEHDKVKYEYFIKSDENELMTKNLQFTFIELPNHRDINSPEATRLDKFCWLLRNMSKFKERPDTDGDPLFDLLVESADFAIFTPDDKHNYSENMTTARDIRNQIQYEVDQEVAKEVAKAEKRGKAEGIVEGREEGIEETKLATAKKMLAKNYSIDEISEITGLSMETLNGII